MTPGSNSRPVVGAALRIEHIETLPDLRDFLLERDRDVEIQDFIDVEALRQDWASIIERGRRALDGHTGRVGMHGPFLGLDLDTPDPDVRAIVRDRMLAGVRACRELAGKRGDPHMVVHSPFSTWHWHNRGHKLFAADRVRDLVHLSLSDAVLLAEDLGVTIVIENIEDKDPVERVELARSFNSPAVKVSLDTGHAHYAHGSTGAPPVDFYVRAAGDMLAHVHLQDADGFADRHWAIGEGTVRWPAVFRAIGELDVTPRLLLELNDARDLVRSARWLEAQGLAF